MRVALAYDDAPPLAAPARFFLTAPAFGVLAGLLVAFDGESVLVSRWSPAALAATHLMTAGFMLQAMVGALFQVLPVVAGASFRRPLAFASAVHAALTAGALVLAFAFLTGSSSGFAVAAGLLGLGLAAFLAGAADALIRSPSSAATTVAFWIALAALAAAGGLGVLLAGGLAGAVRLPFSTLVDLHAGWGLLGWGTVLILAVADVAVPMFLMTPAYPRWFARVAAPAIGAGLAAWSVAVWSGLPGASWLVAGVAAVVAAFAVLTLRGFFRGKRTKADPTRECWAGAMLCALAAAGVWFAGIALPDVGDRRGWPVLVGLLVLPGAFGLVIQGMLYKVVPFLIWLRLQAVGRGVMAAPTMKRILPEAPMRRQTRVQFVGVALVVAAAVGPGWLAWLGGLVLAVGYALLGVGLLAAMRVHRSHLAVLAARGAKA